MKALTARDFSKVTRIISKIGIKDDLADAFKNGAKDGYTVAAGILQLVLSNYDKAEDDVFALIAGLSDMTVDEVADMPIGDFLTALFHVFSDLPFFASAVARIQQK